MKLLFTVSSRRLLGAALILVLCADPALARKRPRVWDQTPACPTDAAVLVSAEGVASRFTALSGCREIEVVPQASQASLDDPAPGSYIVPETARDGRGRLDNGYYSAAAPIPSSSRSAGRGDVRVTQNYSAGGVPTVTVALVEDEDAARSDSGPVARPAERRAIPAIHPAPPVAPLTVAAAAIPVTRARIAADERLLDLRADRTTPFDREIAEVARRQRIDPLLLHAVIRRESAYRGNVVSHAGAIGAMQMMPGTGRMLGVAPAYLRHPRSNIEAGARLLRRLAQRYNGNFQLVLAAYNAGEGAVQKYGNRIPPYAETQSYVRAVLGEYSRLAAAAGIVLAGTR